MFGRKGTEGAETEIQEVAASTDVVSPIARAPEHTLQNARATHALARRMADLPTSRRAVNIGTDESKLIVGKGLTVAGEITACDILVVEGKVEAKLNDGKLLEIAEAGQFRGSVEIENADIAGRFDGQLVVRGRLTVRATGRISGMIKYGEMEVSAGGQIIGEMQAIGGQQQMPMTFKNAPAAIDDDSAERKSA